MDGWKEIERALWPAALVAGEASLAVFLKKINGGKNTETAISMGQSQVRWW